MLHNGMGSVIDGDSSAFFDHVPHDTRRTIRRTRSKDGRVLELIERWLQAGLLDGKERVFPDKGSPHGAVRSPRWANVYVHEVLDPWCETVVQAHGRGQVVLDRYADDVVMGGKRAEDARRISEVLPQRCAKDGLESNPETTTVVRFGRPQRSAADRHAGTVSCLGVVHSWGKTWRGSHTITRQTEGKRLRRSLGACWRWCRDHRHRPL